MSNIALIVEERATRIGNFMVGRLLPFREKRSVGPFVFIDHMGPLHMNEMQNMDILPHPHIGLSTLTYLFEGAIMHRDSIGSEMEIKPGAINWMTAGKGIVHSERTPERLRNSSKKLHGLQIWVALPKELEQTEPAFTHIPAAEIPNWQEGGIAIKLIAGEAFGKKSPVPTHSPLYLIEIKTPRAEKLNLGQYLFGETALYILEGEIKIEENSFSPGKILVAENSSLCEFETAPNTTIYIFGGEPFPEPRYIDWNFVSSNPALIEKAKQDWVNQRFPKVPGESDFVPLPVSKLRN